LKNIGLLGGSFDPPHQGHLHISIEGKKRLKLDEVWWLVTPQNPLKISKPATYKERVNNCKIITKNFPIKIKEIEKKINSNYSFKTINFLQNHYRNINFFWLMGADNLIEFHHWQKWKDIFYNIPIVIFKRHGYNTHALKSITKKTFEKYRISNKQIHKGLFKKLPAWVFFDTKEFKISSTEIRNQREILRGKN
tara:strand:+ start:147 stop:728 length:582 start_codon:yes stop_codon:yes gene_type:complete